MPIPGVDIIKTSFATLCNIMADLRSLEWDVQRSIGRFSTASWSNQKRPAVHLPTLVCNQLAPFVIAKGQQRSMLLQLIP